MAIPKQEVERDGRESPLGALLHPSDARQTAPVFLRALLDEAGRLAITPDPFFRGLGFGPADLDCPGLTIAHQEATTVIRRALLALGNPSLGLQMGLRSRVTHFGILGLAMLSSPSPKASIALMLRYPMSAGFMLNVRAVDSPARYALVTESIFNNHDIADFLVDKLFAGLVQLQRQISEVDFSPVQVELMRAPRGDYHDHQQHYRCPVRFNCTHNRLVFDPKALNWTIPSADVLSLRTCERLLDQEARSLHSGSAFTEAVRRAIALTLPLTPTTTQLASMLHLSERSLRRKLAQEKLSFRALLDEGRRTRALDLVTHGQRSIADVAAESGFGDPRAFRRAFRRWTGESPTAWPLESKAQVEDGNGSADGA